MIKIWSMKKNEDAAAKKKPKTSAAQLRVQKDITELDLPETMKTEFPNAEDLLNFTLSIRPDEGIYKGAEFKFSFNINTNYPHEPPKVKCIPKIYHPNVDLEGNVCLNILREDWKPVLNLNSVMVGLQYLFLEPNAEDPLNKEAAEELRKNRDQFIANVKRSMQGRSINGVTYDAVAPRDNQGSAPATSIASQPPSPSWIHLNLNSTTPRLDNMSGPRSPVSEHGRRSTDSNQHHQVDAVHRSHHVDSGLDVSEDANEEINELDMKNMSLDDRPTPLSQDTNKPSPPSVPVHLPPKNKVEDVKHMKQYQEMMEKSRAAERQKKHDLEQRRLARERAVEDSLHVWQREVVPNWKDAIRKPHIRQMWWRGIPTRLRGEMWIKAVGNGLAISKESYKRCLARSNRALTSGSFPVETMAIIEEDIRATLPALHIFHPETGPLYQDLKDLLCAWVVSRSDEGLGYVRGVASIGGMFLINMPGDDAFICMRNLLERHCLRSFYGGSGARDDIEAYYRIFDTLLADGLPKVFFNFKQHQISPSQYLPDWILPMFLHHLPFEACARIWDVIILEGDSFLYRAALAIIAVIESRLFFPDRKELMEVLRGENKAALEVAKRSGLLVDQSARYEQYGMNEEVLWAQIVGMDEWWKESTWSRLIQRELPDV
ncbi:hypothetical protein FRC11_000081 [Ceratobasidium sp. 423]|nr:hypothetical protein FRC11_000081 [Ceratobasidium sp. 423]